MWMAFETKNNYKSGEYHVALDGLIMKQAVKKSDGWYIDNEKIPRETIFYINVPDEQQYVVLQNDFTYRFKMKV